MKIQQINSIQYNYETNKNLSKKQTTNTNTNNVSEKKPLSSFSSDVIKANYAPNFGRPKTKIITLQDRATGQSVPVKLMRDTIGDYFVLYSIYTMDKKEAGFLRLGLEEEIPEDKYLVPEPENVLPKVQELRSIEGDKIKGIGTTLINEAMKESYKRGKGGCLWLHSQKGYGRTMSEYRKNENPIPFYYKLGFVAVDKAVDKHIKECLENNLISSLPNDAILILTSDVAKEKLKKLDLND